MDSTYRGDVVKEDVQTDRGLKAPEPEYLKTYLMNQLDAGFFTNKEWKLVSYLIDCLDDHGLFVMEVSEVAAMTGCSEQEVSKCLVCLKALEPFGVFASDLEHCLLRQLEVQGIDDEKISQMVLHFLPEIGEGKISTISRSLKMSTAQVRGYIRIISNLNPRPLSGLYTSETSYIVPDIIYRRVDDNWEIELKDGRLGEYSINGYYLNLMRQSKDEELYQYFKSKLERTRFILNSVEQRKRTITSIAEKILERQENYFLGTCELRPMTMTEIAEELMIHPSTVSRASKGKYIQFPSGTILMKKLFSGGISCGKNQAGITPCAVKDKITCLIQNEDKRNPYSDAKIAELLKNQGINLSRRAVAKYRDELYIKGSFDRRNI